MAATITILSFFINGKPLPPNKHPAFAGFLFLFVLCVRHRPVAVLAAQAVAAIAAYYVAETNPPASALAAAFKGKK